MDMIRHHNVAAHNKMIRLNPRTYQKLMRNFIRKKMPSIFRAYGHKNYAGPFPLLVNRVLRRTISLR